MFYFTVIKIILFYQQAMWNGILDEGFLLTKCDSKATKLEEIVDLNLSGLGLSDNHIDPEIFNKLHKLEELHLDRNDISVLPSGLIFEPTLKLLDLSQNNISSTDCLVNYQGLNALLLQDCKHLDLLELYKIAYLLPNLECLNMDKVNREKLGSKFANGLKCALIEFWHNKYAKKFKKTQVLKEQNDLFEVFIENAKEKVKYGVNSMKVFKSWLVGELKEEVISYIKGTQVNTTIKPIKHGQTIKKKTDGSPENFKPKKRKISKNSMESKSKKTKLSTKCLPVPIYKPCVMHQIHSKSHLKTSDYVTSVWCCEFEPKIGGKKGETTDRVATCGGEVVNFIDCLALETTSQVIYTKFHMQKEEFYTISWSTVSWFDEFENVAAVAGHQGVIYILHPQRHLWLGEIKSHKKPVQALKFLTDQPTRLLSADQKGNVLMHDIGLHQGEEIFCSPKKLMSFSGMNSSALKLVLPLQSTGWFYLNFLSSIN